MEKLCSVFYAVWCMCVCCGRAILFDVCPGAVIILILTWLSFVRVYCRLDVSNVSNSMFTLTLSESCRNMGNSNNKGLFVCGNRCSGGFSQTGNRPRKLTRWHLVCTIALASFLSNYILCNYVSPHADSFMWFDETGITDWSCSARSGSFLSF